MVGCDLPNLILVYQLWNADCQSGQHLHAFFFFFIMNNLIYWVSMKWFNKIVHCWLCFVSFMKLHGFARQFLTRGTQIAKGWWYLMMEDTLDLISGQFLTKIIVRLEFSFGCSVPACLFICVPNKTRILTSFELVPNRIRDADDDFDSLMQRAWGHYGKFMWGGRGWGGRKGSWGFVIKYF